MRTRRLLWVAKIVVTLALSCWLGARMIERDGFDGLLDRLGAIDGAWIAVAVALHFAAVLAGVLRWRGLLEAARIDLPFAWLARSFVIGRFVGAFTPSTTGLDGWRLWEAGRASGAMGKSAAAIAVEKLVGLVGMAIVCAALLPFGGMLGESAIAVAVALASGAAIALAILMKRGWIERIAERMPAALRPRAAKIAEAVSAARLSPPQLARAIALGLASHAALSAVFWATARALHVEVDALALIATGNAIVIAVLLPISIGGVGVRESVAVVLLASAGVASTDAVLVALLGYLTGQAPALLGGVLLAARREAPAPEIAVEQTLA